MKMKRTKIKITEQGGPVVNSAYIVAVGNGVVAVDVDLSSKYCVMHTMQYGCGGDVEIGIGADKYTLHQKRGKENIPTRFTLPDFKGWTIHSTDISRYTLSVCLVKLQPYR